VAQKKAFLLRVDPSVYDALQRWAAAEFRSVNGQIEYVLRRELVRQSRMTVRSDADEETER